MLGHVLRNGQPEAAGTDKSRSLGAPNSQLEMARALEAPPGERELATPAPPKGQHIEHFGYVDGRSIPAFLREDIDKETSRDHWDPSAPLSLVLTPDPMADEEDSFGSCFVFRKLEQNVSGFSAGVQALAATLGIAPELAGAYVVGRFKDGTPVTRRATPGLEDINDFDYQATDRQANRCPFHAHIRKADPRGEARSSRRKTSGPTGPCAGGIPTATRTRISRRAPESGCSSCATRATSASSSDYLNGFGWTI